MACAKRVPAGAICHQIPELRPAVFVDDVCGMEA